MTTTRKHAREARLSALHDVLTEMGIDPACVHGVEDSAHIIKKCANGSWSIQKTIANLVFRAVQ